MRRLLKPFGLLALTTLLLLSCQAVVPLTESLVPAPTRQEGSAVQVPSQAAATPANPSLAAPAVDVVSLQDTLVRIYEQANPGVVSLRVVSDSGDSQGSGFVYDLEGHILTNYHVVSDATELEVRFPSGYKVFGEIVGTDLDSDVAVVKVDAPAEELHPLPLGDSDGVKVGQVVIAIGTPFQFNGTMTLGIVSALGRTLASLHQTSDGGNFIAGDIIQTDAAINPGNSGGPLLNLNGEVIGINRAIVTENITTLGQPVNSGLGFSVSINIVKRVAPHLIAEGSYDYPYVGINSLDLSEFTLAIQEELNLPRSTGVYITRVVEGGPADRAGFRGDRAANDTDPFTGGGDLIIAIDGQPVITYGDFIGYLIKNKSPNDTVVLTVLRDGQEMDLKLTLGTRPSP